MGPGQHWCYEDNCRLGKLNCESLPYGVQKHFPGVILAFLGLLNVAGLGRAQRLPHLPAAASACTRGHLLEGEPPDEVPHLLPEPSGQSKP